MTQLPLPFDPDRREDPAFLTIAEASEPLPAGGHRHGSGPPRVRS